MRGALQYGKINKKDKFFCGGCIEKMPDKYEGNRKGSPKLKLMYICSLALFTTLNLARLFT